MDLERLVLHLDMDAFFASCEEVRHPELRGQPLVVGAAPSGGDGRGVVVAANYPARAFGIRSAMPIRDAWRRNPHAHYLRPDHAHYSTMSRRIFSDLRAGFAVEQASIDECYIDITGSATWDDAARLAEELRQRVSRATGGLTCSIGVGPNRLVAKVASDHRKPGGLLVVPPAGVRAFLDPLQARKLPGVGPRTAERLHDLDISTIQQLREADPRVLAETFGGYAQELQRLARGEADARVHPEGRTRKSMSEEHTFDQNTRDPARLLGSLRRMMSSLERDLRRRDYWYRSVAVKVRFADFSTHTRQAALPRPASDTTPARRIVPQLIADFLHDPRPVRLLGVRFGDLGFGEGQRTLTDYGAS